MELEQLRSFVYFVDEDLVRHSTPGLLHTSLVGFFSHLIIANKAKLSLFVAHAGRIGIFWILHQVKHCGQDDTTTRITEISPCSRNWQNICNTSHRNQLEWETSHGWSPHPLRWSPHPHLFWSPVVWQPFSCPQVGTYLECLWRGHV